MDASCIGKFEFSHPCISHPGFIAIFPKTVQQNSLGKDCIKAREPARRIKIHHDVVGKMRKKQNSFHIQGR